MMGSKFLQLAIYSALLLLVTSIPCPNGQYSDANNLCQRCQSNCATCSSASFCSACIGNTFLVSRPNSITCEPCGVVLSGCSICLTNIACQTCSRGYYLKSGACTPCRNTLPGCEFCSTDGAVCTQCRYPFQLINNTCISATVSQITDGAQTINSNSSSPKVTLNNGTVVNAVLDANGCNQLQVYWNGKCIKSIDQCQVYQPSGLCQVCNSGYLVTIFGDCTTNSSVLNCQSGYWLDSLANTCKKVDVSCDWYYPNNGSCYNCSTNYKKASNGQCLPAINCTSREFFFEGRCVEVALACLTFLSNGTCTSCAPGNTLKDGVCSLTIVNVTFNDCVFPCSTCFYAKLDYCFSCRFGYQLENHQYGTCVPILYP